MRILLTNDDGIDAPGLAVLERIARQISDDIWIVAPRAEQSGAARGFSFNGILRINERDPRRFSIEGTPVDCVMLAAHRIMKEHPPDIVLSGVNRGQNIGDSVTYSGTISAAAEGAILGIPSIALSQAYGYDRERDEVSLRWETAEAKAPDLIRQLIARGWPSDIVLNVNFPDRAPDKLAGVRVTRQGQRFTREGARTHAVLEVERREDPRGRPYYWLRFPFERALREAEKGTDLHAIDEGAISITPLHFNLTHDPTRAALEKSLRKINIKMTDA